MRTQTYSRIIRYIILTMMILTLVVPTGCGTAGVNASLNTGDNTEEIEAALADADTEASISDRTDIDVSPADGAIPENNVNGDITGPYSMAEADYLDSLAGEKLDSMSLEEKVAQMFIVFPESLVPGSTGITQAEEITKAAIDDVPVGGIIYMTENIKNPEQVRTMLANVQEYSMNRISLPIFLCVDEEGGRIARIANNKNFGIDNVGSMMDIGAKDDIDIAYIAGANMGAYLSGLGFNLDFAPVADVCGDSYNAALYSRTFSDDPYIVSKLAGAISMGLESKGVISVYKHFPGHGSTVGDPHKGYAYTNKTLSELKECDLIPFEKAIRDGASMIMVGHISLPNIVDDGRPASLSNKIITDELRNDLGYQGVVVTDAMNMGAIKDAYEPDEAAVMAVSAGVDIILMPKDFQRAYTGIINAVKNGDISEDRIDCSVLRILKLKYKFFDDDIK